MPNYRKLYYMLFAATADAVDAIEQQNYGSAKTLLIEAQLRAETTIIKANSSEESKPASTKEVPPYSIK